MPRGRSAISMRSDISEMVSNGTEAELAKLQRQFRIMEGERQAYSLLPSDQIRKQQQEIERLRKEQEELHQNHSFSQQQLDSKDTKRLRALLGQKDMLEEDMAKEQQCQKDIDTEIANMQLKLEELRKGKFSTGAKQMFRQIKAVGRLEDKLNRASTCFNEQLTRNSHLREELQSLHIERVRFQQLQNMLEKELHDDCKKIRELVNLSTAEYDAREEAQSKMTIMREQAVKDLAKCNAEMKELDRIFAHECSLKEFMTTKCSKRSGQEGGHETGHRQKLKEQRRIEEEQKSLDALEEVFKRIQTVTGEDNLDMLVTRFIQVEDQNFALFNFVNDQNNEAKALRNQISQIQAEIEHFQEASSKQEQDQRSLLRGIDEQQKKTESQAEDNENQASIIRKILNKTKTGLNSIVSRIECDRSVIEDAMRSPRGISENNLMSYLSQVEQKANELLTIQAFINFEDVEKDYNL